MISKKIIFLIKKNYLVIIFTFVVGLVSVLPYIIPVIQLGDDYSGIPFIYQANEDAYLARIREVVDAPAAIKEMHRVLKNNGKLYIDVPFIYPFHSSPGDYFRWTVEGVKYLINPLFHATEVGVRHGPTSAFLMILASWLSIIFSFGSNRLYQFINIILILILAPFGHVFDFLFGRFKSSHNIAAGFYIIGEKLK